MQKERERERERSVCGGVGEKITEFLASDLTV
jgi:hypothetical protein